MACVIHFSTHISPTKIHFSTHKPKSRQQFPPPKLPGYKDSNGGVLKLGEIDDFDFICAKSFVLGCNFVQDICAVGRCSSVRAGLPVYFAAGIIRGWLFGGLLI